MRRTRGGAGLAGVAVGAGVLTLGATSCGGGQSGPRRASGQFARLRPATPPTSFTPKQGPETLANWSRFRTGLNRGEGSRDVRLFASSENPVELWNERATTLERAVSSFVA